MVTQTEQPPKPTYSKEIEATLYPPKLVMDHQSELGIEETQRATILEGLRTAQSELVEVDWQLRGEKEKLASVLFASHVDEEEAFSVAERVMRLENRIKTATWECSSASRTHSQKPNNPSWMRSGGGASRDGPTRTTRHPRRVFCARSRNGAERGCSGAVN